MIVYTKICERVCDIPLKYHENVPLQRSKVLTKTYMSLDTYIYMQIINC